MIKGRYTAALMLSKNLVLRLEVMSFHDEKRKVSIFFLHSDFLVSKKKDSIFLLIPAPRSLFSLTNNAVSLLFILLLCVCFLVYFFHPLYHPDVVELAVAVEFALLSSGVANFPVVAFVKQHLQEYFELGTRARH